MRKILGLIVMLGGLVIPIFATGSSSDNISIPHTFDSGAAISSSQMDQNFNLLIELLDNHSKTINQLISRIETLENPPIVTISSGYCINVISRSECENYTSDN